MDVSLKFKIAQRLMIDQINFFGE